MDESTGTTIARSSDAGDVLKRWRQRRRLSQQALADRADLSTRHLSFIETGRSAASRDMLLRLADGLELPHRERDRLLMAGGYAPLFKERPYDAADMAAPMAVVEAVLRDMNHGRRSQWTGTGRLLEPTRRRAVCSLLSTRNC